MDYVKQSLDGAKTRSNSLHGIQTREGKGIRKRIIKLTTILVILLCSVTYGKTRYVASKNGLNLRAEPSLDAEILETINFAATCDLIDIPSLKGSGWYKVRVMDMVGYVQAKYLKKKNPLDDYSYMGNWMVTAYTHTGSACANGNYPTDGYTIACNSLDFGTEVYIDGIGFRVVEDRGPSYLGSEWLDLFCDQYSTCVAFGVQYHDVYVVMDSGVNDGSR